MIVRRFTRGRLQKVAGEPEVPLAHVGLHHLLDLGLEVAKDLDLGKESLSSGREGHKSIPGRCDTAANLRGGPTVAVNTYNLEQWEAGGKVENLAPRRRARDQAAGVSRFSMRYHVLPPKYSSRFITRCQPFRMNSPSSRRLSVQNSARWAPDSRARVSKAVTSKWA